MDPKRTGEFIAKKRKEKNITQIQLANLINVTNKAVSRWETGTGFPDITLLPKIASVLDCTINELLYGENIDVNTESPTLNNSLKNFNFILFTILLVIALVFLNMIFIILSFGTLLDYLGISLYLLVLLISSIFYVYNRQKYIILQNKNLSKKKVFTCTLIFYLGQFITLSFILPLIISFFGKLSENSYYNGIIKLNAYFDLIKTTSLISLSCFFIFFYCHYTYVFERLPIKKYITAISLFLAFFLVSYFCYLYRFKATVAIIFVLFSIFIIFFNRKQPLDKSILIFIFSVTFLYVGLFFPHLMDSKIFLNKVIISYDKISYSVKPIYNYLIVLSFTLFQIIFNFKSILTSKSIVKNLTMLTSSICLLAGILIWNI